ncbi:hypothetical protein EAG_01614 [Camponotus floridanus]|uniref:Uncharacterized protein n=1 Tax=Camponotus floridanus TaxID=104421 RepID=E2AW02_CAMFO|nr:hypothetical protein EAG_01614 [Camponotus floridanus]
MSTVLTCSLTPRLRPSVIQNSGAGYHGYAILIFSATSKGINAKREEERRDSRNLNPTIGKIDETRVSRGETFGEKKRLISSDRQETGRKEKRKTRRLRAGQSYCTMFTSSAAPNDHDRGAHARARDPHLPLSAFPSRPAAVSAGPAPPPALRNVGGDLQFGAAECRSTARGGCRRGRRSLARACNSRRRRDARGGGGDGRRSRERARP